MAEVVVEEFRLVVLIFNFGIWLCGFGGGARARQREIFGFEAMNGG